MTKQEAEALKKAVDKRLSEYIGPEDDGLVDVEEVMICNGIFADEIDKFVEE